MEMQSIKSDYCEQLYTNKLDKLGEMGKFLEAGNLLKLNQEEIENMNRLIVTNKVESKI